jgi:hypothetical protein
MTKIQDKNGQTVAAAKSAERRSAGRPRKYGQGRVSAHVRFTPERYAVLKGAADANGRSVSEQVEWVVEAWYAEAALKAAMRHDANLQGLSEQRVKEIVEDTVKRMLTQTPEQQQEAIVQALARRNKQKDKRS